MPTVSCFCKVVWTGMTLCMCMRQGAARSFAFASGMAALAAVLRLAQAGDHVVAGDDLYGGTSRLLAQVAPQLGLNVTHVDTSSTECARLVPDRPWCAVLHAAGAHGACVQALGVPWG